MSTTAAASKQVEQGPTIELDSSNPFNRTVVPGARICVVGVGGAGGNACNTMIDAGITGVEFIAVNCDAQDLRRSKCDRRFQLGKPLTQGLGAGADSSVGREAALLDREPLAKLLVDNDLVFVTVGLGGGTGTGAAPVVAQIARKLGALTVGVVTTPFAFEGKRREATANKGLEALMPHVDTLIHVSNQRMLAQIDAETTVADAFLMVDKVLMNAVRGVADLITIDGIINVDFADVRTVMKDKGLAILGTGEASGPHRTAEAARAAMTCPVLADRNLVGARWALLNITGPPDLGMLEVNEAATLVQEEAHEDVELIWGWVADPSMGDRVRVTLIATGFDDAEPVIRRTRKPAFKANTPPKARTRGSGPTASLIPTRSLLSRESPNSYDIPTLFGD